MTQKENDKKFDSVRFIEKFSTDNLRKNFDAKELALEALDNVSDFVFISDSITKNIVYMNKALTDVVRLNKGANPRCYSLFRQRGEPCLHCRNNSCAGEGYIITHNNLRFLEQSLVIKSTQITIDDHVYTISIGRPKNDKNYIVAALTDLTDETVILKQVVDTISKYNSSPNLQLFSVIQFIGQLTKADSVSIYEKRQVDANLTKDYQRSGFWSNDDFSDVTDDQNQNLPDDFIEYAFTFLRDFTYKISEFKENNKIREQFEENNINSVLTLPVFHGNSFLGMMFIRNASDDHIEKNRAVIQFLTDFISIVMFSRLQSIELNNTRHIDQLTGFRNRNALLIDIKGYATLKNIGILSVNINGLKKINQKHGLERGDSVIIQTGNMIKQLLRIKNIYRISGDEFLAIIPEIADHDFEMRCDTLLAFLSNKDSFTASIGWHWVPDGHRILKALNQAERNMNEHKKEFYRKHPNGERYRQDSDIFIDFLSPEHIQKHIDSNSFQVYYQPKVSLSTGEISGAEALVRLFLDGRMISPNEFITPLDAAHYTYLVDFFVFESVCSTMRQRLDSGLQIKPVSCNFSRHTFVMNDFIKRLTSIMDKYDLPYDLIPLEISERSNTSYQHNLIEVAATLDRLGFKISIDDFGVAHANINDLALIPVRELKFDKKLIDSLLQRNNYRIMTILDVMITMCRKMKIKTVAEGVEKEIQEEILKNLGCDEVQGYLHGKPVDMETYYSMI